MTSAAPPSTNSDSSPAEDSPRPSDGLGRRNRRQRRSVWNFSNLTAFQVLLRSGWIFKTESIIMPAVADLLGAGSWLRGCLPVLSRFGLSIPPLMFSRRVRQAPRKRAVLCLTSLLMSASFLTLSAAWWWRDSIGPAAMPAVFLGLYVVFFMAVGVNQLAFGTLSGKLIRAERRGRLMLVANVIGAGLAIGAVALLLPRWLGDPDHFTYVFAFSGAAFAVNSAMTFLLIERADKDFQPRQTLRQLFGGAWQVLERDRDFRRIACIAGLFGLSFALFPHYQAIALGVMGQPRRSLLEWVIVQNLGTALFSLLLGPLADRRGNRSALRTVLLCVLAAPLLAITLPHVAGGDRFYSLVFLLVGMTPVTVRIMHNYVLELTETASHPLYLSTLSLVVGVPVLSSPLIGMLVDVIGFTPVFLSISTLVLGAWLLTWRLREPRSRRPLVAGPPPQL